MEFRVFVSHGIVTGVTQYHQALFVPEIVANLDEFKSIIISKHSEIQKLIEAPDGTYTVDYAILGNSPGNYSAVMLEINEPPPVAGTALFDWNSPQDRDVLARGPMELRVIHEPVPWEMQTTLHQPLKDFIDEYRGRHISPSPWPCVMM